MGLMVHSLGELPAAAERGYYIYVLDYGWREPLADALYANFDKMADAASKSNAVVVKGCVGAHFADEVLSWHHVNGLPGDQLLPALLITTRHPSSFRDADASPDKDDSQKDRMLLIPLRECCRSSDDVVKLIEKVFRDIRGKKQLSDFDVKLEMTRGKMGAVTDALVLQPNVFGIGVNLSYIIDYFQKPKK